MGDIQEQGKTSFRAKRSFLTGLRRKIKLPTGTLLPNSHPLLLVTAQCNGDGRKAESKTDFEKTQNPFCNVEILFIPAIITTYHRFFSEIPEPPYAPVWRLYDAI